MFYLPSTNNKYRALLVGIIAIVMLSISGTVSAKKPSNNTVAKVHEVIQVKGVNKQETRLAVLKGMWFTRGFSWHLEQEGDGFAVARFDYRGSTIIVKIVYDDSTVAIQYVDGDNDYACRDLRNGICFNNDRSYYNYAKNLRASIVEQLEIVGSAK